MPCEGAVAGISVILEAIAVVCPCWLIACPDQPWEGRVLCMTPTSQETDAPGKGIQFVRVGAGTQTLGQMLCVEALWLGDSREVACPLWASVTAFSPPAHL